MNVDQASRIIVKPYITEKTFAMVENESKVCFIVERSASKPLPTLTLQGQFMVKRHLLSLKLQQKPEIWQQR